MVIFNLKNIIRRVFFLLGECLFVRSLNAAEPLSDGGITYGFATKSDYKRIRELYWTLSGSDFSRSQKCMLRLYINKQIVVAKMGAEVLGFNYYYRNLEDKKKQMIHEGYIGVLSSYNGKGVATSMRKYAHAYFRSEGLKGVSSRISEANMASLNSARKLGFKVIEKYFDAGMNECRYYLICTFNESDS